MGAAGEATYDRAVRTIRAAGLDFPLVAKPEIGQRGAPNGLDAQVEGNAALCNHPPAQLIAVPCRRHECEHRGEGIGEVPFRGPTDQPGTLPAPGRADDKCGVGHAPTIWGASR